MKFVGLPLLAIFFTVHNSSCGKVMFSQACVKNSVHRRVDTPRVQTRCRHPPAQCMLGYTPPPPGRLLQQTVRILLECILVLTYFYAIRRGWHCPPPLRATSNQVLDTCSLWHIHAPPPFLKHLPPPCVWPAAHCRCPLSDAVCLFNTRLRW